jgi:hypothetical protein
MEAENLPEVTTKRQMIEAGTAGPGWFMVDGMVVHDDRLFMPASATAWPQILARVMKECKRLYNDSELLSPRQGAIDWCENISKDCFSHYRFPAQYGLTLQWILLNGSLKSTANR